MGININYDVHQIPVHCIKPNPNQPRHIFDEDMLKELAVSIEKYGIMQPINVRKIDTDEYELVAGERRLRAAKLISLETIPAIIVNVSKKDSAVLALIENLQRENLNYVEEAKGYQRLISNFELKQQDLANQLGKSQSTIANKLRLLQLSDEIHTILLTSKLSERHARALLKLKSNEQRLMVINKIVKEHLNVKETETLIIKMLKVDENEEDLSKPIVKRYIKDIRIFTNTIKQAVDMVQSSGLEVDYQIKQTENAYEISIKIPIEG